MGSARKGRVRTNHPAPTVAAAKLRRNLKLARTAAAQLAANQWLMPFPDVRNGIAEIVVRIGQCQAALEAADVIIAGARASGVMHGRSIHPTET
jgi:hypothetical protein